MPGLVGVGVSWCLGGRDVQGCQYCTISIKLSHWPEFLKSLSLQSLIRGQNPGSNLIF